jgi:drug/metabolite transporter (DMT)-like permease
MGRSNRSFALLTMCNSAGVWTIFALLIYAAQNHSGHTGFNPYHALVVFVPLGITGLSCLLMVPCPRRHQWLAVSAILIGLFGVMLLIYLDQSNTLLPYEVWIDRGMP